MSAFTSSPPPVSSEHDANSRKRLWLNNVLGYATRIGGMSVLLAIALIFFYLLYIVFPLLSPVELNKIQQFSLPAPTRGDTLILDLEERALLAARFTRSGEVIYFDPQTGDIRQTQKLLWPDKAQLSTHYFLREKGIAVFGFDNGQALVVQNHYGFHYVDNQPVITPTLTYPLGKSLLNLVQEEALQLIHLHSNEEKTSLATFTKTGRLLLRTYTKNTHFLTDEVELTDSHFELNLESHASIQHMAIDGMQDYLYLADDAGRLYQYSLIDPDNIALLQTHQLDAGTRITQMHMLLGGISLMVGEDNGRISQWFPVRDETDNVMRLQAIRSFHAQSAAITEIIPEQRRKGFLARAADGSVGLYHATAHRVLKVSRLSFQPLHHLALSARADHVLLEDAQGLSLWQIHNPHPEISWSSLWRKVWYESHSQPEYLWQSSSASEDAEPKFSLTPLAVGTLKASFYALLFAVPLAVIGGIYTAHFMAPGLRRLVKPGIELMEALPTVILGFLAGLWMAPLVEKNLPGVFAVLLMVPLGVLLFAWIWHQLPHRLTARVLPEGWHVVLLLPVVALLVWSAFSLSEPLEQGLFAGNMRQWLNSIGVTFDQRNAIVVGVAMGFAIIPSIFSITEDAVMGVPKHLTLGSLALGATPWQTLLRVVILTASPGIFSAIMIGMGRAVGETMIVLMATGNTPIMNFNIFEGMRTLAANIAIEMPESEYNNTHYRVLFLAALVLFVFTFCVNTVTEIVRHRLRKNYSTL